MDLKFHNALFAAGAALMLIGAISLIAEIASSLPGLGALEAFSRGFDIIFLAFFSGVLMGVGIALAGDGLVLRTFGSRKRIFVSALFSILFLSLSTLAIFFRDESPLSALVCFFAFISASAVFLITSLWYVLSDAAKKYLVDLG
ncbi:MAG: hypothetical protein NTX79_07385 [Candidatus Micrarchaeota archaeon]|nr:hypothetical protein [Candidatus Micrarchaeota archaeon]